MADGGRVGKLFLAGVPMGVDVAIGSPAGTWLAVDCCGVIPDKRGLLTRPLASPLDRGTSDSLSRKLTNNSENDCKTTSSMRLRKASNGRPLFCNYYAMRQ